MLWCPWRSLIPCLYFNFSLQFIFITIRHGSDYWIACNNLYGHRVALAPPECVPLGLYMALPALLQTTTAAVIAWFMALSVFALHPDLSYTLGTFSFAPASLSRYINLDGFTNLFYFISFIFLRIFAGHWCSTVAVSLCLSHNDTDLFKFIYCPIVALFCHVTGIYFMFSWSLTLQSVFKSGRLCPLCLMDSILTYCGCTCTFGAIRCLGLRHIAHVRRCNRTQSEAWLGCCAIKGGDAACPWTT